MKHDSQQNQGHSFNSFLPHCFYSRPNLRTYRCRAWFARAPARTVHLRQMIISWIFAIQRYSSSWLVRAARLPSDGIQLLEICGIWTGGWLDFTWPRRRIGSRTPPPWSHSRYRLLLIIASTDLQKAGCHSCSESSTGERDQQTHSVQLLETSSFISTKPRSPLGWETSLTRCSHKSWCVDMKNNCSSSWDHVHR